MEAKCGIQYSMDRSLLGIMLNELKQSQKDQYLARHWWLMPAVLAILEAQVRRTEV
jgi:hypothetical protein